MHRHDTSPRPALSDWRHLASADRPWSCARGKLCTPRGESHAGQACGRPPVPRGHLASWGPLGDVPGGRSGLPEVLLVLAGRGEQLRGGGCWGGCWDGLLGEGGHLGHHSEVMSPVLFTLAVCEGAGFRGLPGRSGLIPQEGDVTQTVLCLENETRDPRSRTCPLPGPPTHGVKLQKALHLSRQARAPRLA